MPMPADIAAMTGGAMSTSRLSTRGRAPALVLTAVLLLAACSNDKSATISDALLKIGKS